MYVYTYVCICICIYRLCASGRWTYTCIQADIHINMYTGGHTHASMSACRYISKPQYIIYLL